MRYLVVNALDERPLIYIVVIYAINNIYQDDRGNLCSSFFWSSRHHTHFNLCSSWTMLAALSESSSSSKLPEGKNAWYNKKVLHRVLYEWLEDVMTGERAMQMKPQAANWWNLAQWGRLVFNGLSHPAKTDAFIASVIVECAKYCAIFFCIFNI